MSSSASFRRHQALLQLFSHRQLRDSLSLAPQPSLRIALVAALQAALAVLVALAMARFSPWPQLVGYPALGALAALFGRFAPVVKRMRIVALCAVLLALAVFIPSLASLAGAPPWAMMVVLALIAGGSTLVVSRWQLGGPGAVILVFAAGASLAPVATWGALGGRTLGAVAGGIVACLVCGATDWMRRTELPRIQMPAAAVPSLRAGWMAAGRIAAGAGLSAAIAHALGWHHPAWAAIGATAVMQGAHLHITMNRALQRMAGTVVGAVIVGLILAQEPSFWWIALCVVAFQFVTEIIIGYNYALGQITVTPMALLMTHLASPAASVGMPQERVMDTILGAALGIVFAVVFSSMDDRVHLRKLHQKQ